MLRGDWAGGRTCRSPLGGGAGTSGVLEGGREPGAKLFELVGISYLQAMGGAVSLRAQKPMGPEEIWRRGGSIYRAHQQPRCNLKTEGG